MRVGLASIVLSVICHIFSSCSSRFTTTTVDWRRQISPGVALSRSDMQGLDLRCRELEPIVFG